MADIGVIHDSARCRLTDTANSDEYVADREEPTALDDKASSRAMVPSLSPARVALGSG